jgi:hypothetical protein
VGSSADKFHGQKPFCMYYDSSDRQIKRRYITVCTNKGKVEAEKLKEYNIPMYC